MFRPEKRALLLSGGPGVGKTTIIKEAVAHVGGAAGGFYTEEIREQGVRQGFRLVTLAGEVATLAHISIGGAYRVSRYGVDVEGLERVGVTALREAIRSSELVVVDEIGKMELFSSAFREAVLEALEGGKRLLGTIMSKPHPWADRLKRRPEVEVVMVTRENRGRVLESVTGWLGQLAGGASFQNP
ncbi:MAG TPA: NTPase [Dehalococcoidia bacterium]|nr:NTPase [Dehalococcoidia bacterium]